LNFFNILVRIRNWELETGNWELGIGNWELRIGFPMNLRIFFELEYHHGLKFKFLFGF
jgi:hypothetical protein